VPLHADFVEEVPQSAPAEHQPDENTLLLLAYAPMQQNRMMAGKSSRYGTRSNEAHIPTSGR